MVFLQYKKNSISHDLQMLPSTEQWMRTHTCMKNRQLMRYQRQDQVFQSLITSLIENSCMETWGLCYIYEINCQLR